MESIERSLYINQIEKHLGKGLIIVLVGQRRVGKSYMLRMVRDAKISNSSNNVIFIDKEKRAFDTIKTIKTSTSTSKPNGLKANITTF